MDERSQPPIPTAFDSVPYKHAKFIEATAGTCVRVWNIEALNENNLTTAIPAEEPSMTVGEASTTIIQQVRALISDAGAVHPEEFEKDNDQQMDFIATAANVRAVNHGVGTTDWLEAKQIAGTIIRRWSADLCASRRISYIRWPRNGSINLACARFSFNQRESSQKLKLRIRRRSSIGFGDIVMFRWIGLLMASSIRSRIPEI
jgi:hypothetical protein